MKYILSLPFLAILEPASNPLYIYLATSSNVINAVSVRDKGKLQQLVYLVDEALRDVETRYYSLEKAALALVTIAW